MSSCYVTAGMPRRIWYALLMNTKISISSVMQEMILLSMTLRHQRPERGDVRQNMGNVFPQKRIFLFLRKRLVIITLECAACFPICLVNVKYLHLLLPPGMPAVPDGFSSARFFRNSSPCSVRGRKKPR